MANSPNEQLLGAATPQASVESAVCPAIDSCHTAGTMQNGVCSSPAKADGSSCDDGNPCTANDSCSGGACVGGGAVTCKASDACHVSGTCDPTKGCPNTPIGGACSLNLIALPLTGCSSADYNAEVTLGDQQTYSLLVDSGSSTTAVAASTCTNCGTLSPEYTPGNNAVDERQEVQSLYGDGSGWVGTVYKDVISFGKAVPDMSMNIAAIDSQTMATSSSRNFFSPSFCTGVAVNNTAQGILGMADTGIALPDTSAFMNVMMGSSTLADAFSVQLCDLGGRLWIGGFDPNYMTTPPVYTPMDFSSGFYVVHVTDIQVGGVTLGLPTSDYGSSIIADTGTSDFVAPTPVYDAIVSSLEGDAAFLQLFGQEFFSSDNCAAPAQNLTAAQLNTMLPTLSILMPAVPGGAPMVLTLPATESYLTPELTSVGGTIYCPAMDGGADDGSPTILGNTLMHSQITIFDRTNHQLGFAPQAHCDTANN